MTEQYILMLDDPHATLETVGGKGASLARLSCAGLPVPGGFHVTTEAYKHFVAENRLQDRILAALPASDTMEMGELEKASRTIQTLFLDAPIPGEIETAVTEAYTRLHDSPVAVRSSATAEDLPGLSFAGQQETYLNITGLPAVLDAIKRCWASLWTARAIGYRAQHGIPSNSISLAVVVQELVQAESAGVMFTANPANGRRDQAMITAAWGLGEAIVGGMVNPDTLVVNKVSGEVVQRDIVEKAVMTVRVTSGTEEQPVPEHLRKAPVLSDAVTAELTRMGSRIEGLYGQPMDIEWVWADGKLFIVQARPITALPELQLEPPTEWVLPNPKWRYGRGSIIDLLPDPLTPLFRTLGGKIIEDKTERMYERISKVEKWPFPLFAFINDYAYMSMSFPPKIFLRLMWYGIKNIGPILRTGERNWREDAHPNYVRTIERWQQQPVAEMRAVDLLEGTRQIFDAAVYTYTILQTGLIPASTMNELVFSQFYQRLIKRDSDPAALTFLLGFESEPIRAEKALYDIAQWAKASSQLAAYLAGRSGSVIAKQLQSELTPSGVPVEDWQELRSRFSEYLRRYGLSLFDLDFSKPTLADDPGTLLDTMRLYLSGQGRSPYERTERQAAEREQAVEKILRRTGGLKRKWFLKTLKNAQTYTPLREEGLADLGLGYPLLRQMLLELGRRLEQMGVIAVKEDVFWLLEEEAQHAAEALDRGASFPSLQAQIIERKAIWNAEKRVTPPSALPRGSRFLGLDVGDFGARTEGQEGDTIKGAGAYPGRITGVARVLHGPEDFDQMQPGDILVASITTPAWTPLFAKAAAIVTDVGGPLSHSSIVAREYGIPAVLGTGVATRRIQSGQIITVDGSTGLVSLKAE